MLYPAAQIGVIYGNPEVTSGGNALKFYASVRLEVRRKATQESAKGDSIGIRVKAKVCLLLAVVTIQASSHHAQSTVITLCSHLSCHGSMESFDVCTAVR